MFSLTKGNVCVMKFLNPATDLWAAAVASHASSSGALCNKHRNTPITSRNECYDQLKSILQRKKKA